MKLTLSKETLRTLAVKSAVRAGFGIEAGNSIMNVCPGIPVIAVGPGVSKGAANPCFDPNQNIAGNPGQGKAQAGANLSL